jgi:uncharacterized membrane protein
MTMLRRTILFASIGLFLASLTQHAYCTENLCGDGNEFQGLLLVIVGIFGIVASPAGIAWFANPSLLIAWVTFNKVGNLSLYASIIAAFLSFSFLFFDQVVANEAGGTTKITSYNLGYWLWLSSSIIIMLGNIWFKTRRRNQVIYRS